MPVFVFASRSAQWLYIAISERRIGWFWLLIYLYTFRKSREFRPIAGDGCLFKIDFAEYDARTAGRKSRWNAVEWRCR